MESLRGCYAAAATPLDADYAPALDDVWLLLDHLAAQGCNGALLLGTTGEGPSFSVAERVALFWAAAQWRTSRRSEEFKLMGGTGCTNLPETLAATCGAFEAGLDAVLLLPPFYYKSVTHRGLTDYFRRVADEAVPNGRRFLVYHIPQVSGVPVPVETIRSLSREYPDRFAGVKDSGADLGHTVELIREYPDLAVFTGTDNHLLECLSVGGAGAITALANVYGDLLGAIRDGYGRGEEVAVLQDRLSALREATSGLLLVAAVKVLLAELHALPEWPVRPPLESLSPRESRSLLGAVRAVSG